MQVMDYISLMPDEVKRGTICSKTAMTLLTANLLVTTSPCFAVLLTTSFDCFK